MTTAAGRGLQGSSVDTSGRHVCVLAGGRSSEREVSLASGAEMHAALASSDFGEVCSVEIELDGRWKLGGASYEPGSAIAELRADAIYLLALHGGFGENGSIQGFLEVNDRIYTGSGVAASALCMNKTAARELMRSVGIDSAPAVLIPQREWARSPREVIDAVLELEGDGWVVKPNSGGSSVATSMVENPKELAPAIQTAIDTGDRVLVEARIRGVEASVGVIGNADGQLTALPPIEIRPHDGRFFDYEEKYSESGAREICPPEGLDEATCDRLQDLATRAHDAATCDGYSRIDFIVPDLSEPVFLEVNTLPGFTARSLFPQEALAKGIEFEELLREIVGLAILRHERDRGVR